VPIDERSEDDEAPSGPTEVLLVLAQVPPEVEDFTVLDTVSSAKQAGKLTVKQ
jgi:hypothetical protein